MTREEGRKLPEGTLLVCHRQNPTKDVYGKLEFSENGSFWFIFTHGRGGWPIQKTSVRDWARYEIADNDQYMLARLGENKMESTNFFRKYSDLIAEAEQPIKEDQVDDLDGFEEDPSIQHDDQDLKDEDDALASFDQPESTGDPVGDLSFALQDTTDVPADTIRLAVEKWLSQNKYELTPVGGLINRKGTV